MTQFLAVYTGSGASRARSGWDAMDPDERAAREAAGMESWGRWMSDHASSIVVAGGPLGSTKRVSADGVSDVTNNLVGYVVIEAGSFEEAAAAFENHPHFAIFPGDAVEIMECLPVPVV